ncbi:MAG: hypothetical protein LH468_09970 [Nocardioides sp.]|nr:hypothetical protein [Nocardioides sp.]
MRPLATFGTLLGSCLLVACGGAAPDSASDAGPGTPSVSTVPVPPATAGSDGPPDPSVGTVESDEVTMLSETAAGGEVSTVGVELSDQAAVASFGELLTPRLVNRVARVVARTDPPVGSTRYGAVVAIGCDVPPGVVVSRDDTGVLITAAKVTAPAQECFAPVTSVALVVLADD